MPIYGIIAYRLCVVNPSIAHLEMCKLTGADISGTHRSVVFFVHYWAEQDRQQCRYIIDGSKHSHALCHPNVEQSMENKVKNITGKLKNIRRKWNRNSNYFTSFRGTEIIPASSPHQCVLANIDRHLYRPTPQNASWTTNTKNSSIFHFLHIIIYHRNPLEKFSIFFGKPGIFFDGLHIITHEVNKGARIKIIKSTDCFQHVNSG